MKKIIETEQPVLRCPFCTGRLKDLEETGYVLHLRDKDGESVQDDEWDIAHFQCEECSQGIVLDERNSTYFLKKCTCNYEESEEATEHSKYCSSISEYNPWNK